MGSKKEEARKNRIYKNGCLYHPTKPGVVVALNPYGLPNTKSKLGSN